EDRIDSPSGALSENPLPRFWYLSNHVEYDAGVTNDSFEGRASAYLKSKNLGTVSNSTIGQTVIVPDQWKDSRVKMTAYLKTIHVEGSSGLCFEVQTAGGESYYDFMNDRSVKSDTDWTQYQSVLDVPNDAVIITTGFWLRGRGEVRADNFQIEKVNDDVELTGKRYKTKNGKKSQNLDFEDLPDSFLEALEEKSDIF
ncbi:MAG: hypothetical protein GY839_16770, partial [candidate division Zixibacteria bacterium]|nr:hypothetical protein [candidate division Zixibacteria bacterium]